MRPVLIFLFFLLLAQQTSAQLKRFSFTAPKMGSPFTIVFFAGDSLQANRLAADCFHLVDSFNLLFSDYIDTSELSRLSTAAGPKMQPVKVSPAMLDILLASKKAWDKSGGAFDITIGPLTRFWRKARKTKYFPTDDSVQLFRDKVGFKNLQIDAAGQRVTLLKEGMQLDLGGIAQGWIAQRVIDRLKANGIQQALINVSGDIIVSDPPPGTTGWTIGINIPETTDDLLDKKLLMHNIAVTTSGDAYQYIEHNGKRYSHIVDPRTGYGVTYQRNVTAIANDCTTADWLATACSILPIKKAKKLATEMGGEVLIAEFKKGKLVFYATGGFSKYWKPATP